jgi:hypothetical protein
MGELTIARERFEQSLALYCPEMHDSQIAQYGTDLGVAGHCYHALTLWHLGYPDQADDRRATEVLHWHKTARIPSARRMLYLSQLGFIISAETCPQRKRKPRPPFVWPPSRSSRTGRR